MHPFTLSTLLILCIFAVLPLRTAGGASSLAKRGFYSKAGDLTALQKHVSFFDRNKDGVIYREETYEGLRAVGLGVGAATLGALFINGGLSPSTTSHGKSLSPLLPVYVENISQGKHFGDTGTFDSEGRFVPEKFEEIFTKYAKTNPNALTSEEVDDMLQAIKDPNSTGSHFASLGEWKLLYELAKDKDGLLQKDTVRSVYDGSLFYKLAQEISSSQNKS